MHLTLGFVLILFLIVVALLIVTNYLAKLPAPVVLWINIVSVFLLVVLAILVAVRGFGGSMNERVTALVAHRIGRG